ncbi:MAG: hypothetical protein NUW37_15420 [Planctomycetes bacterium]|nr:hypothetical protein [Planctomycetota bacterium]
MFSSDRCAANTGSVSFGFRSAFSSREKRKGAALIVALSVLFFLMIIGIVLVQVMHVERRVATNRVDYIRAQNMARTGIALTSAQTRKVLDFPLTDVPVYEFPASEVWWMRPLKFADRVSIPVSDDTIEVAGSGTQTNDPDGDGDQSTIYGKSVLGVSGFRSGGVSVQSSATNVSYLGSQTSGDFNMGTYEHLGDIYKLRVLDASGKINIRSWNPYKPSHRRKIEALLDSLGKAIAWWVSAYTGESGPGLATGTPSWADPGLSTVGTETFPIVPPDFASNAGAWTGDWSGGTNKHFVTLANMEDSGTSTPFNPFSQAVIDEIVQRIPTLTSMTELRELVQRHHRTSSTDNTDYFVLVEPFVTLESWPIATDSTDVDWWDKYNKYSIYENAIGEDDAVDPLADLTAPVPSPKGYALDPFDYDTGVVNISYAPPGAGYSGDNHGFEGYRLNIRRQGYDDRHQDESTISIPGYDFGTSADPRLLDARPRSPVNVNAALPPVLEALIYGLGARVPYYYFRGDASDETEDDASHSNEFVDDLYSNISSAGAGGPHPQIGGAFNPGDTAWPEYEYSQLIYLDARIYRQLTDASNANVSPPSSGVGAAVPKFNVKFIEIFPFNDDPSDGNEGRGKARTIARLIYHRVHEGVAGYNPFLSWEEFEEFVEGGFNESYDPGSTASTDTTWWPIDPSDANTTSYGHLFCVPASTDPTISQHIIEFPWKDRGTGSGTATAYPSASFGMDSRSMGAIFDFNPYKNAAYFAGLDALSLAEARRDWDIWYNQAAQDILIANFNPNVNFQYSNPDFNQARVVSKFDLVFRTLDPGAAVTYKRPIPGGTTELMFTPGGIFEITCAGIITAPVADVTGAAATGNYIHGRMIAASTMRTSVKVWDIMQVTTQRDFMNASIDVDGTEYEDILYLTSNESGFGSGDPQNIESTVTWPNSLHPRLARRDWNTFTFAENDYDEFFPKSAFSSPAPFTTMLPPFTPSTGGDLNPFASPFPPSVTKMWGVNPGSSTPGGSGTNAFTYGVLSPFHAGGWVQLKALDADKALPSFSSGSTPGLVMTFQAQYKQDVNLDMPYATMTAINADDMLRTGDSTNPEWSLRYNNPRVLGAEDDWFPSGYTRDMLWPNFPTISIMDNRTGGNGFPLPTVFRPDGILNTFHIQRRFFDRSDPDDKLSGMAPFLIYRVFPEGLDNTVGSGPSQYWEPDSYFGVRNLTGWSDYSGPLDAIHRAEQKLGRWNGDTEYRIDTYDVYASERTGSTRPTSISNSDVASIRRQTYMSVAPYAGACDFWLKLNTRIDSGNLDNNLFCGLWGATVPMNSSKVEGVTMLCYIDHRGYLRFSKLYWGQAYDRLNEEWTGDSYSGTEPQYMPFGAYLGDSPYQDAVRAKDGFHPRDTWPPPAHDTYPYVGLYGYGSGALNADSHQRPVLHRRYYSQKWVRNEVFVPLVRYDNLADGGQLTLDSPVGIRPHEWHHVMMAWSFGTSMQNAPGSSQISYRISNADERTRRIYGVGYEQAQDMTPPGVHPEYDVLFTDLAIESDDASDNTSAAYDRPAFQVWIDGFRQIDYSNVNEYAKRVINAGPNIGHIVAPGTNSYTSGGSEHDDAPTISATPTDRMIVSTYGRTNELMTYPRDWTPSGPPIGVSGALFVNGVSLGQGTLRGNGMVSTTGDYTGLLRWAYKNITGETDPFRRISNDTDLLGPSASDNTVPWITQAASNATMDDFRLYSWDIWVTPDLMSTDFAPPTRYSVTTDGNGALGYFENAFLNPYSTSVDVAKVMYTVNRPRWDPLYRPGVNDLDTLAITENDRLRINPDAVIPADQRPYVQLELQGYTVTSGPDIDSARNPAAASWAWNSDDAQADGNYNASALARHHAARGAFAIGNTFAGSNPAPQSIGAKSGGSGGVLLWRAAFMPGTYNYSNGTANGDPVSYITPTLDDVSVIIVPPETPLDFEIIQTE